VLRQEAAIFHLTMNMAAIYKPLVAKVIAGFFWHTIAGSGPMDWAGFFLNLLTGLETKIAESTAIYA
jgi:hypothetical protein